MNNHKNIHYFWRLLLHVQKLRNTSNQSGYAMLITSILAILVFSMLSVYLFSTNLYKSVATAMVDSGTTFYAAEYGLNKRAHKVRLKFEDFGTPAGTSPTGGNPALQMQACINSNPTSDATPVADGNGKFNDFECRMSESDFKESVVAAQDNSLVEKRDNKANMKYRAYSFVRDITSYSPAGSQQVETARIPVGDDYAGLNALEYGYRVYTTALKRVNNGDPEVTAQSMLQMDFNNRLIPLFQFAVFYQNDLEIANGPDFTIDGPVHTNSDLLLAPDGSNLTFNTNVTTVGSIYKSLEFKTRKSGYINFAGGTTFRNTTAVNTLVTPTEIANSGLLRPNQRTLTLPPVDFLSRAGVYYRDADMRVDFAPNTNDPIKVRAFGVDLNAAAAKSLMQPVLVRTQVHASDNRLAEITRLCSSTILTNRNDPGTGATATSPSGTITVAAARADAIPAVPASLSFLTAVQGPQVVEALQKAIAKLPVDLTNVPLDYTTTQLVAPTGSVLKTNLTNELNALSFLTAAQRIIILATPLNQIAALDNGCFVPAPMQIMLKRDRREVRDINILQSNINSLTVWNRDGRYWDGSNLQSAANLLFPRNTGVADNAAASALPVVSNPVKAASPCGYDCMGLGSSDTTQGGLVWHFSIDKANPAYAYSPGQSKYGFAFNGARRLPGALTIATDQAVYLQGDFNNPSSIAGDAGLDSNGVELTPGLGDPFSSPTSPSREKRPSSILSDTIGILSNACSDNNNRINCMITTGTNNAVTTVVRAGFLSRTDVATSSRESGQLENYVRFLENWSDDTGTAAAGDKDRFVYRGSILSLGTPTEFSGAWNGSYYVPPRRFWGFDRDFNSSGGLPPMTPRASYLKQKVFRRDYNVQGQN